MDITERDIETKGLRFRALEAGEGPLVLCMHGYPDTAHTWDALIPKLVEAGFHVVAPWMRGYPPTDLAPDGDYSVARLGRDVLDLADALGAETFSLVGHDWGASTVYQATGLAPERVQRLVTIAIPPIRAIKPSLADLWSIRHFFAYAVPWLPERQLQAGGSWQGVRDICRRWSPSWTIPDDEFAHLVASFEAPGGLQGALGYYRSFVLGTLGASGRELRRVQGRRITVPTMLIYGAEDIAAPLYSGRSDPARAFADGTPFEVVRVETGGHFVHREEPDEVGAAVVRWLTA